ncbi:unnamed protein product [Durusdinium trenchii]|uniref:Uncharacterized protein n=1 Tax=Durusdinium trenchii TaxID=1381693 RepID=A0ABP0N000_9DINO
MKADGHTVASFDVLYGDPKPMKQDVMNLLTPSGFALAALAILNCKMDGFVSFLGLLCSSYENEAMRKELDKLKANKSANELQTPPPKLKADNKKVKFGSLAALEDAVGILNKQYEDSESTRAECSQLKKKDLPKDTLDEPKPYLCSKVTTAEANGKSLASMTRNAFFNPCPPPFGDRTKDDKKTCNVLRNCARFIGNGAGNPIYQRKVAMTWEDENLYQDYFDRGLECANPPAPRSCQVPCSHVVEMAKAQVESNPHASPALKEFARIRPEDAETACHEVLTKYGFSVPIPVETLNIGPGQLKACPFVRPSAWATYLLNKGILPRQLVGVADRAQMEETLREHWKRYQVLFPNHPIFRLALEGTVQLQRCVPILSHSDEGRSTKHLPLFVMSFHGALGRGTQLYVQKQKHLAPLHRRQFGLNFLGQSWGTQFLCFAILREMVDDNPDALKTLIQHFARDFQQLAEEGIVGDDGYRVWLIHISTKGDLPALTKLSNSGRSFWHVARAATSRKPCDGICHLCKAGSEKPPTPYPFEDFSLSPKWAATLYDIPWGQLPPILEGFSLANSNMEQGFDGNTPDEIFGEFVFKICCGQNAG